MSQLYATKIPFSAVQYCIFCVFFYSAHITFDKRVTTIKINSSNWHVQIKWNNGKNAPTLTHIRIAHSIHLCVHKWRKWTKTIVLGPNGKSDPVYNNNTEKNLINSFSDDLQFQHLPNGITK